MTIPEDFKKQVSEGGLRFEAYLPPDLALQVVDLVEKKIFTSPSEAVFVAMQTYRDLERHSEVKRELLQHMLMAAERDIDEGRGIPHEKVMAKLDELRSRPRLEPAVWDRSMDNPWFEEKSHEHTDGS